MSASSTSVLTTVAVALAVGTVIGIVVLWPGRTTVRDVPGLDYFRDAYRAGVVVATSSPCQGVAPGTAAQCVDMKARLLQGPEGGRLTRVQFPVPAAGTSFRTGQEILLVRFTLGGPNGPAQYSYLDRYRLPSLWWLAAVFAGAVILLGRIRGVGALVGLALSFLILLRFILPAIVDGESPVLVALVGSSAIAFLALISRRASTA